MKCKSIISKTFEKFLLAMKETKKRNCHRDITFQIYYDLFKIRESQWKYKLETNRGIDYSLSEIFQDIIAHYLRIFLSKKHSVLIEFKQGSLRPDILIKKNGKNYAIIEIKTTIGWNRNLVKNEGYMNRLNNLSKEFKVPVKRIFYIFESSRNVNNEFADKFRIPIKKEKIHNFIYPLFEQSALPYYISKKEKIKFKKYSNKEIFELYNKNKITDFKNILKKLS